MAISNFEIEVQTGQPLRRELGLPAGAQIDYEIPAQRTQRGLLVATRAATSSVVSKEITRGFQLDVSNVDEPAGWNDGSLQPITLQETNSLAALTGTLDLSTQAADPESDAIFYKLGTVPTGIQASLGVGQNAHILTYTYPAQTSNPASNLSFNLPLSLEQPLGTKLAGSDRNLTIRVLRYSPQPIHTSYFSPIAPGRQYIDRTGRFFQVEITAFIQNHSNRPLLVDNGTDGTTSWDTTLASYSLTTSNGRWYWRADRADPFPFSEVRTANVRLRIRTNDNGDQSTVYQNWLVRIEPPAS